MLFWIELITVSCLGLILGSFSTALAYRVPREMPWGKVRSACPACKTVLGARDLVPFFSWALSGGKCSHCHEKVHWRYPLTEIISAVLCVIVYFVFGLTAESLLIMTAVPFLLALFVVDLEHMILPNQLVLILFMLGVARLAFLLFVDGFHTWDELAITYGVGAILYMGLPLIIGIVMSKILKKDSLGMGDVKFFFVAGIWLGLYNFSYYLILSGSLAIVFALVWRLIVKKQAFPFGPALITTFYGILVFQGPISL